MNIVVKNIVWMGKNMLQDVNVFVKIHKKEEILNSIIVCIRYIHMAFSMNMGIDTEVMMPEYSDNGWNLGDKGCFSVLVISVQEWG